MASEDDRVKCPDCKVFLVDIKTTMYSEDAHGNLLKIDEPYGRCPKCGLEHILSDLSEEDFGESYDTDNDPV